MYFTYCPVQIYKIMFRRFSFSRIWSSAQDYAVLGFLPNPVVFLISAWQKSVRRKWFVLAVYQVWKGISAGPALKYFTWFIGAGGGQFMAHSHEAHTWVCHRVRCVWRDEWDVTHSWVCQTHTWVCHELSMCLTRHTHEQLWDVPHLTRLVTHISLYGTLKCVPRVSVQWIVRVCDAGDVCDEMSEMWHHMNESHMNESHRVRYLWRDEWDVTHTWVCQAHTWVCHELPLCLTRHQHLPRHTHEQFMPHSNTYTKYIHIHGQDIRHKKKTCVSTWFISGHVGMSACHVDINIRHTWT